ncbi:MAG: carbon-nitrogen hydrolase family protein [Phycisphaeraceae bacterium]
MKLALAQMRVEGGCRGANLQRAVDRIAEAAQVGADVVLLPEALNWGWTHPPPRGRRDAIPDGASFKTLADAAAANDVWVCAGLVEISDDVFNAAVLLDRAGELVLHHRKIHELPIAHHLYARGCSTNVATTEFGTAGVHICADAAAPGQWVGRQLGEQGAQFILSPCAWAVEAGHDPAVTSYGDLWRRSYKPVAQAYGLWIAGCSCVGRIDAGPWKGRRCIGNSIVIGPDGEELLTGPHGEDADVLLWLELG